MKPFTLILLLLACGVWFVARGKPVTQGDGSRALLRGIKKAALPSVPKVILLPPRPPAIYFIAATAYDASGLESDFSNECQFTNKIKTNAITLAWDRSASTNVSGYNVYRGRASGAYSYVSSVGNVTQATVWLNPPPPTNVVVTVNGSETNWSATNPPGMRWFKGTNMRIAIRRF